MKILIQSPSSFEGKRIKQYAITNDIAFFNSSYEELEENLKNINSSDILPVGSVEFLQKIMDILGVKCPEPIGYPCSIRKFLKRSVQLIRKNDVQLRAMIYGSTFIKPSETIKSFTGFVLPQDESKIHEYDKESYDELMKLPGDTTVWCSDVIPMHQEYRYYIHGNDIIGYGRYDELEEENNADRNLDNFVLEIVKAWEEKPIAFSVDVSYNGDEPVLVELNDAWALGLYLSPTRDMYHDVEISSFIDMLHARWIEITKENVK